MAVGDRWGVRENTQRGQPSCSEWRGTGETETAGVKVIHTTSKTSTVLVSTTHFKQDKHNICVYYTLQAKQAQYLCVLHITRKTSTILLCTTHYKQNKHNTCVYYTPQAKQAQYLYLLHTTCKQSAVLVWNVLCKQKAKNANLQAIHQTAEGLLMPEINRKEWIMYCVVYFAHYLHVITSTHICCEQGF